MDDDDAGPPSLFVVVYYDEVEPHYFGILQIETPQLQQLEDHPSIHQTKKRKVEEEKYVIRFNQETYGRPRIRWLFSPPTSSTEDLYLVPNWGYAGVNLQTVKPLEGYKFNLRTGICETILPPSFPSELEGRVVILGGHIYLLGYDSERGKQSVFQCYDPDQKSWEALEPFPPICEAMGPIVATAALDNTILINLGYHYIMAYDVIKNKWYEVGVEDEGCYFIEGEAVVVGDAIYALTRKPLNQVLALSIEHKPNDGGLVLKCSSKNVVQGMVPINDLQDDRKILRSSRHLVHLGKDNFCIVQSCNLYSGFNGSQEIKLTYVRLEGENSVIVKECVHEVKIQPTGEVDEQFDVLLCFALPKGATTALEDRKIFHMKPFPEDNDSSRRNTYRPAHEEGDFNRTQAVGSSSFGQIELKNDDGGLISETSDLEDDLKKVKDRLENIQKEKESLENDLMKEEKDRTGNDVKKVKDRLEEIQKEKESLENTRKNILKEIENDLNEAKEMIDLLVEKCQKALRSLEESNKPREENI